MSIDDPTKWFNRIEPGIGELLAKNYSQEAPAFLASAAISLKRIADALEFKQPETIEFTFGGRPTTFYRSRDYHSRNVYRSDAYPNVDIVLPVQKITP